MYVCTRRCKGTTHGNCIPTKAKAKTKVAKAKAKAAKAKAEEHWWRRLMLTGKAKEKSKVKVWHT